MVIQSVFSTAAHPPHAGSPRCPHAKPTMIHKPVPVPIHWRKEVVEGLARDVRLGVLEKVPKGTVDSWCSRMVVVSKKDGMTRRTVDLSPLNRSSVRETHHTIPAFTQLNIINKFKYTTDAWNRYHSVKIREEDMHKTTFITESGRHRYKPSHKASAQLEMATPGDMMVLSRMSPTSSR